MKLLAVGAIATLLAAYNPAQLNCTAQAVYHESRGESLEGQQAVAWVVVNRTLSDKFPDTACDVVSQKGQFSWYGNKSDPDEYWGWVWAVGVASYVYIGEPYQNDPTKGALFFHADSIKNPWPKLKKTVEIGHHVFYR